MNNKEVLLENIKKYNEAYRQGAPIISDAEYDQLIDELKTLDPNNDWFNQIEPSPVSNKRKVKLPIPMKSLNKVKSLPEIQNWIKSLSISPNDTVVVTPKFDGLSLLYSEKTGKAYSRGGIENEGQDCTEHYNMLRKYEYTPQSVMMSSERGERDDLPRKPMDRDEKTGRCSICTHQAVSYQSRTDHPSETK